MWSKFEKNITAILITAIVLILLILFAPLLVSPSGAQSPCPATPEGILSPQDFADADWEDCCTVKDRAGTYWFFVKKKNPSELGPKYAIILMEPSAPRPYVYNYVENGTIKFIKWDSSSNTYVVEEVVDLVYNFMVKVYKAFMNVNLCEQHRERV
jgi:hypothetical protein